MRKRKTHVILLWFVCTKKLDRTNFVLAAADASSKNAVSVKVYTIDVKS